MLLQVSRFFSAMLQLANNGNIVILRGSDPGQAFQLRLASLEKWHQQFQDYRAPSFLQPKVHTREIEIARSPPYSVCWLKCMLNTECLFGVLLRRGAPSLQECNWWPCCGSRYPRIAHVPVPVRVKVAD